MSQSDDKPAMAHQPKATKEAASVSEALAPSDLRLQRERFLAQFTRGSAIAEEFLAGQDRLLDRLRELEGENAGLRARIETDTAVRQLLVKIEHLEAERAQLISRSREAEQASNQFNERVEQFERELSNFANLFVASSQLHSTLSPRGVVQRVKDVLAQLVGAECYGVYIANAERTEFVPVASEGIPADKLVNLSATDPVVAPVFGASAPLADEQQDPSKGGFDRPAATVPLSIEERVVGAIVVYRTLAQKTQFQSVDFELFRLLGQQAASALIAASLFVSADRRIPGLEAFIDLSV